MVLTQGMLCQCSGLQQFDVLEKTLADGREFLVNNEFSVADIAVGYATNFLKMVGVSGDLLPAATNSARYPVACPGS